jgi:hypothetical protein
MNDNSDLTMQAVDPSELQNVEGGGEPYVEKFLSILFTLFPVLPQIINA